jgi:hypothetical protein
MDARSLFTPQQINEFCLKHHIRQFSFFGSVTRDDFNPQSDIDILIEFEDGYTPGYDFFLMEEELSNMAGRKVDLQTPAFLSPEIRHTAMSESLSVYEQA